MSEPSMTEADRRAFEEMQRVVDAAKAAGTWETGPEDDSEFADRFEGPIGADAEGNVIAYATSEEAMEAAREARRRQDGG